MTKSQKQRLTCWATLVGLVVCEVSSLFAQATWQQTTEYPIGAFQYDPIENSGQIYVLGGYNGTLFDDAYFANIKPDGSLGAWTATTPLPQADQGPGVTVYNGWVYVALGSGAVYRAQLQPGGGLGSWIAEPSVEQTTSYRLALRAYKGYLYLFGRYDGAHHNVVRIAPINPNGSLGAWATGTMPQPRHHQAVHFHNDRVYLVGGVTSGNVILNSVYSAPVNGDGTLGTWRQEADLPTTLWYHNTVRIGNWIYLFGGWTGYSSGTVTNIIYRGTINPDGTLSGWTVVETMPSSYTVGAGAVYAPAAGRVYLIGGNSGSSFTQQVWRKDYSLVAHYPFDGDANDASGNGNHGTVRGATLTSDRFGITNRAYYFNGTSDSIKVLHSVSLDLTNSLTVAAWVKLQTDTANHGMIAYYGDAQDAHDPYVLSVINRQAQFRSDVGDGSIEYVANSSSQLPANVWLFVAGTKEVSPAGETTLRIYVNGQLAGETQVAKNIEYVTSGMWLCLGAVDWGSATTHHFNGSMDDVRIYNRALSGAELTELYLEPRLNIAVSQVRLCWDSRTNNNYQLQYRSVLTANEWTNLGSPIVGNGGTLCVTDEVVSPQRFYRVIVVP